MKRSKMTFLTSLEESAVEQRVTSTPRTMSPVSISSPSASSIGDATTMEENSQHDSEVLSHNSTSDHFVLRKIKWPNVWYSVKPKPGGSLYYQLTNQPNEVESIVVDLISLYQSNARRMIKLMLQLFVDLCGYKNVSVEKIYNFEQQNSREVIERLETDLMDSELKDGGKYIFKTNSKIERQIEYLIAEFLTYLVAKGYKTAILFDDVFPAHIFQFINCMAFSGYRFIRTTGVILVTKFLTAFLDLYKQVFSTYEEEKDDNSNSESEMVEKKHEVESIIDFLYKIYEKNCMYPDSKCYLMKVKCAREMFYWIKLFPEVFVFKRKCLGRLMKLILDENENVRLAALDTCAKLLEYKEIQIVMLQRIELCLNIVSGRFKDVSCKVAAKAVNVFTSAVNLYFDRITKPNLLFITRTMYFQNILVAKAGGKFLATYLERKHKDAKRILISLAHAAYLDKKFSGFIPFFVESCIEFSPQLKNWTLFISIFLNDKIDFQTRTYLVPFFKETVKFTLTNKFTKSRVTTTLYIHHDDTTREQITHIIITNFNLLISRFRKDINCINQIVEILTYLDNLDHQNFESHHISILRMLKELFVAQTDKDLLETITKVFSHLKNQRNAAASNVIKQIIKFYVNTFKNDMKELSNKLEESLMIRLEDSTMKMSVLFEFFDLTESLHWEDIFDVWNENTLKSLEYTIVCCKWYLVWSLRQYMKCSLNDPNQTLNLLLYGNCKEFIYSCLDLLQKSYEDSRCFLIFQAICDLYANFEKEMVKKRMFSKFFIVIEETKYRDILIDFVVQSIIKNDKLVLSLRQIYLSKFVDVIYLNVIPVDHFSRILCYYHTHYVEFGEIMNHILTSLYWCNPGLPCLVQHTLATMYNEIVTKCTVFNLLSKEAKQLKLLAKKLSSFKLLKFGSVLLKLVHMMIYFSFKSEQNHTFLYFARYFAQFLNSDDKGDAYKLFKRMVPKRHKSNDIFSLFSAALKSE